jgi:4-hydroxybenzoate polyprenyltransferase
MPQNAMLRAWLELARISNLPTVWTNVTTGWLLAGGGWEARLGWLLLGGSLLYTGGMILNDAADVKFDREHRQERPIPSGRVSSGAAWMVGLAMLLLGAFGASAAGGATWSSVAALVACILFYDLYHKPWKGAVWIMGLCRVLLVIMSASAFTDSMPDHAGGKDGLYFAHALALGSYIVGLTLVARSEAAKGAVPPFTAWFPRVLLVTPAWVAAWLAFDTGSVVPLYFIPLFLMWVLLCIRMMRRSGAHIGRAVGWLLAGIVIVDALAVSQVSVAFAAAFVVLAPMLRGWQKWIAAT